MYQAVILRIDEINKHPNADRLQIAKVGGYQCLISLDYKVGDLGVFFPSEGQLSHEFCMKNRLYRKHPETNEPMGGLLEPNRRVRVVRLRGVESDGLWLPLKSLSYTGFNDLKEGYSFSNLGKYDICNKYVSKRIAKLRKQKVDKKFSMIPKIKKGFLDFKEHYDTKHLQANLNKLSNYKKIYITEKLEGTSGRTGFIKDTILEPEFAFYSKKIKKFKDIKTYIKVYIHNFLTLFLFVYYFFYKLFKRKEDYSYITGSRRLIVTNNHRDTYRKDIHDRIKKVGLHRGETIYYEIVGYDGKKPIMGEFKIKNKELKKVFNTDSMVFSYGTSPGYYKFFVYRITQIVDGELIELSPDEVKFRCDELGFETVPLLEVVIDVELDDLMEKVKILANGYSSLDCSHIKEGVVLKAVLEDGSYLKALKYKNFYYKELQDLAASKDDFIDLEEVM